MSTSHGSAFPLIHGVNPSGISKVIKTDADGVLQADIGTSMSGTNALLTTANTNTAHISDNLDHLSSNLDTLNSSLGLLGNLDGELEGHTARLDSLITANHTDLAHISDNLDHLSSNLDVIATNTANIKISTDSVNLNVDTLESLMATSNTNTTHISDNLDHLSSNIDTVNANLGSLGNIDGELEGHTVLLTTANTNTAHISDNLDHISANLDTIEATNESIKTSVDSVNTSVGGVNSTVTLLVSANHVDLVATKDMVSSVGATTNTNLTHLSDNLDHLSANLDTIEATNETIKTAVDSVATSVGTVNSTIAGLVTANHTDIVNTKDMVSSVGATTNTNLTHLSDNLDHLSANLDTIEATNETIKTAVDSVNTSVGLANGFLATANTNTAHLSDNLDHLSGDLDAVNQKLGDIETAVQLLDNAVDGNYLNVNSNIAGTDVDGNSGNKSAQTQRVVLATDDIPIALVNTNLTAVNQKLGDIETAVQLIDNAVDGNYLNVNSNIAGTDVDGNSGNKSAQTQRVVLATDDIPTALVNTKLDHLSGDLDTVNQKLGDIETAVQLIDNAVDGNYLNVNSNIAGTDVDGNSGNKSAQTQRVVLATDDIPTALVNTNLTAVNQKLGDIETAVQLIDNAVDGNYLNTNTNFAGVDSAVNSGALSASVQRVCIATNDIPIALINTKLDTLETTADAILVKLAPVKTTILAVDAEDIGNSSTYTSAVIDVSTAKHIGFFGTNTAGSGSAVINLLASGTSGGTYHVFATGSYYDQIASLATITNCPFKFLKVRLNVSADGADTFTLNVALSS